MSVASMQPGLRLLLDTPIGTLLPEGDTIVSFSKDTPLHTAFKGLVDHKILSAPVYDPHRHNFTSFIDIVDIVAFFVSRFSEKELTKEAYLSNFASEQTGVVSDLSGRNPFYPVEAMAPLLSAILLMVKWGVHRVPVVDSEGELITILTQSHVVKFIYRHFTEFGVLSRGTVATLGMLHAPVISVNIDQPVMDAFKIMNEKGVCGVGVIDNDGTLVGNISASDIKVIGYDGALFSKLCNPTSQFLQDTAKERGAVIAAPVCVTANSTFSEVVSKLVDTRIHRLYLVDGTYAPLGVITQLEVLRALMSFLRVQT